MHNRDAENDSYREQNDDRVYRYRVASTWGDVPDQVKQLVGAPDAYLVYPEYRGQESQQALHRLGDGIIGGWTLEYAGERP